MHVNELPNECLINIFQYLSLQDIVLGVRLTCSHWYNLSFNGCLWRHLKLDVGGLASRMSDESFLCLLRSVSESVEDIVFGYSCTISEASILHKGIYCPQLKSIDLRGLNIKAHYIDILLLKYPKIERLFLELNYSENCIHFFRCLHQYKLMFLKCLHVILELGMDYESLFTLSEREDEEACKRNSVLNYLNTLLVESITDCSSLQHLSITFGHMTDKTLSHIITKNKHLTHLSIAYCSKITGSAFDALSLDNRLVSLNMDNTRLTNETIRIIASKCPKLKSVSLRNCNRVTDEGVLYLAKNCPMINKFILNHARFNQHEVNDLIAESNQQYPFGRIQQKSINLSTRVTDIGITSLAHNCYRLCELGLAGCTTLTDTAIKQIAICCPNLTLLNLSGCMYVSDSSINLIILKCRNLEMLFLQTCYNVANIWFLNFSFRPDSSIPRLKPPTSEELDFITSKCELKCLCSHCGGDDDNVENQSLLDGSKKCAFCDVKNYLSSPCKVKQDFALTTFNLDFCNQISDDSLCRIAQNCPLLCEIWLQGCFRITDYGVGQLAEKCPLLTILDVSGGSVCEDMTLTDETLYKLATYSQKLAYLNLVRNWKFTINGISEVLYKCKKLHKVSISRNLKYGVSELSVQNALDKIWACTAIKKLTDTNGENYMILTLYPHSRRIIWISLKAFYS